MNYEDCKICGYPLTEVEFNLGAKEHEDCMIDQLTDMEIERKQLERHLEENV